jgi:acetate kinase
MGRYFLAMQSALLTINAGSSSLKFGLFSVDEATEGPQRYYRGLVADIGGRGGFSVRDAQGAVVLNAGVVAADHDQALAMTLDWCREKLKGVTLQAVGHRVVHGGERFSVPVRVDGEVLAELRRYESLAPLHQPHNLRAVSALAKLRPDLPQVACFDTAFHHSQSTLARSFALPRELAEAGIRRYGFHGLSYEYLVGVLPDYLGEAAEGRVVLAHLGNGASLCAVKARKSFATTMGMTPLDGLMMGTRCGALDPGVVIYLQQQCGYSAAQVAMLLSEQSGLLGVSGLSSDMHTLLQSREAAAQEAIDLFVYRVCREIGSMAAALGGMDALVFTAGIGERSAAVRRAILEQAAWLGFAIDDEFNRRHGPRITRADSAASAWVIPTDEELVIARHTWRLSMSR